MKEFHTRSLIEALFAVAGIWLVVKQLPDFVSSFTVIGYETRISVEQIIKHQGLHLATNILLGSLLIFLRKKLANWLVSNEESSAYSSSELVGVGVAIVGAFLFSKGLFAVSIHLIINSHSPSASQYELWSGVLYALIGLLLFCFSHGIASLWAVLSKFRRVGV